MKKLNLTDKRKPDYFYSEAIKTLRTNIQLSGQSIKTILVTSCFPNEGKRCSTQPCTGDWKHR